MSNCQNTEILRRNFLFKYKNNNNRHVSNKFSYIFDKLFQNMGKPQRRKKMHYGDTHLQRRWRTRNRQKDLDEVSFLNMFRHNLEKIIFL